MNFNKLVTLLVSYVYHQNVWLDPPLGLFEITAVTPVALRGFT